MKKPKCDWAKQDPLLEKYHDTEWGTPVHKDRIHFEFLTLQIFQAGLNWTLVLKKRNNFRKAFDHFDHNKIANYTEEKLQSLLNDEGIIRNDLKIRSTITNAKRFLEIRAEYESFDTYIWSFVNNSPIHNGWDDISKIPSNSNLSKKISKDLKKRGFKFIGSTIIYAFLQSIGIINDHIKECFRYQELKQSNNQ
ncbi:MAG: DNA-3-methyladenine glycosylase I [Promethearchaeota archaeon]